jgi:hypothetical protein
MLRGELSRLKAELDKERSTAEKARIAAEEIEQARLSAEENVLEKRGRSEPYGSRSPLTQSRPSPPLRLNCKLYN